MKQKAQYSLLKYAALARPVDGKLAIKARAIYDLTTKIELLMQSINL